MDTPNYMTMKDADLAEYIKKYDMDKADYYTENGALKRKKLCNILKLIDIQAGKIAETQVIDQAGNVNTHEPTGKKLHKGLSGMMVQITFYNSDDNDLPYVQLALNGIALVIPREEESWIPKEFVDGVLQNAVATRLKMQVDRDGKITYVPKKVPRCQFQVNDIKHIDELRKEFDKNKAK